MGAGGMNGADAGGVKGVIGIGDAGLGAGEGAGEPGEPPGSTLSNWGPRVRATSGSTEPAADVIIGNAFDARGPMAETTDGINAASAGNAPTGSPKPL